MMEAEGILTVLAEVAIAIAGFSGIVVALQHRAEQWSEYDKFRFTGLLSISLSCVFWSLIPILLNLAGAAAPSVWAWTSGLWLGWLAGDIAYRSSQFRRAARLDEESLSRAAFALVGAALVISVGAQVANVVWVRAPWPHVLALMANLLVCSVLFFRLLRRVVAPKT